MRVRLVSVVLSASLLIAAFASTASAATVIRGNSMRWRPAKVTINRGQAVRWKAVDTHHTVTSYGSNWSYSKHLGAGMKTKARTFKKRGTFRFYCFIHGTVTGGTCSGMCGRVVVG